jgi:hypothetical protein
MNDNFSYDTNFDRIYDRLASMLQDNLYYYSKGGQIVENVVRMTEILNLDSDVYMLIRHDGPRYTTQLTHLFRSLIDRCIHPYFQLGMIRHRLNVSLYFNGRLRYVIPTFPGFMNRDNFNTRNYTRYIYENLMTQDRYYHILSDIRDVHGEMFVNLERIEDVFQRQLQQEIVGSFDVNAAATGFSLLFVLVNF